MTLLIWARRASLSSKSFVRQAASAMALAAILLLSITAQAGAAESQYMKLPPIVFSLHGRNHHVERQVAIILTLELKPGVPPISLRPYVRRLQNQLLATLHQLWERSPKRHVSATEIKEEAMPVITSVVGEDKVEHVLVHDIHEKTR